MRKLLALAAVGVLFSGLGVLRADDKDEKTTLKGDGMCAKCALKEKEYLPERRHRHQGRREEDVLHRP